MGYFKWPFTNLHELNLDWVIGKLREIETRIDTEVQQFKFADPLEWDAARGYDPYTIVYYNGGSYAAKKFVPSGININDAEYWVKVSDYNAQMQDIADKLRNVSTVAHVEDAKGLTSDVVTIEDFSNDYVQHMRVTFEDCGIMSDAARAECLRLGYIRDDQHCMMPALINKGKQGGNAINGAIVAGSWVDSGIKYTTDNAGRVQGRGVFENATEGGEANAMVCSDLVYAIYKGVTRGASKCVVSNNRPSYLAMANPNVNAGSFLGPRPTEALITRELAAVFGYEGGLFRCKADCSDVLPGDVLFMTTSVAAAAWHSIGHCAFVVDVDTANGKLYCVECGGGSETGRVFNFNTGGATFDTNNAVSYSEIEAAAYIVGRPTAQNYENAPDATLEYTGTWATTTGTGNIISAANFRSLLAGINVPKGSFIEVTLNGEFSKVAGATSSGYLRLNLGESVTTGKVDYRVARHLYEGIKPVPDEIRFRGYINHDLDTTTTTGNTLALGGSSSVAGVNVPFKAAIKIWKASN